MVDSTRFEACRPKPMECSQELGRDGALAVWRSPILFRALKIVKGREQPGAVRDVKGLSLKSTRNAAARWPAAKLDSRSSQAFI
jgi:hypothetical protein